MAAGKKTIDVEQFYITPSTGEPLDASLRALERAAKRGVKIRFLLEKKFEKNSLGGIARLKAIANLELRIIEWSAVQGSGIVHAKFFVVDSTRAFVGSMNFDWRSLKHIHEMGLAIIGEAQEEILVQNMEYLPLTYGRPPRSYPVIDNALRAAAVRGVKIKLLVSHWTTEEPGIKHLQSLAVLPGVEARVITIPEAKSGPIPFSRVAHSKYMVVDGKTLWLGTSNWRGGYLDDSRDLELVIRDPALAARAAAVQKHLWDSAYTAPLQDAHRSYPKPRR